MHACAASERAVQERTLRPRIHLDRMVLARSKSRAILSSAVGWVSPTEGDLSVAAAEATKRWVTTGNAVIKSQDGSWYTAVKVRKVARAGEFSVLGTPKRRQKARASDEHDH